MKKFISLFTIFLSTLFLNKISKGDIYFDLDHLPIDRNVNFIKFKYNLSSQMFSENFKTSEDSNSNKNSLNKLNVGFNFGRNKNIFYEIDLNNFNLKSISKTHNYEQKNYKSQITFLYPSNIFSGSEIIQGFSFRIGLEDSNKLLCIEDSTSVYGLKNANCNTPSRKTLYKYDADANRNFISSYKREIFGFKAFIKKLDYNWLGKSSLSFIVKSSLIKNNLELNELLSIQHPQVKNTLPQNEDWVNITLNPNYTITRKLGHGWSLGNSYSFFLVNGLNYIQNKKPSRFNSKIEANVAKKLNENFFVSFGGFYSSNYKVGLDDFVFNNLYSDIYNQPYGELYLSIGAFLNKPSEHKPLQESDIVAQINSEILAENEQKLKITQSIGEIIYHNRIINKIDKIHEADFLIYHNVKEKEQIKGERNELFIHALKFAENYDKINSNLY